MIEIKSKKISNNRINILNKGLTRVKRNAVPFLNPSQKKQPPFSSFPERKDAAKEPSVLFQGVGAGRSFREWPLYETAWLN